MQCWKCGAQVANGACVMCGCTVAARAQTKTETGKRLRYVYDKFGPAKTLGDPQTLIRCISDVLADDRELREQLTVLLNTGVGSHMLHMMENGGTIGEKERALLISATEQRCSLPNSTLTKLVDYLLEMVGFAAGGGTANKPTPQQPKPQPVPAEKPREIPKPRPQTNVEVKKNEMPKPAPQPNPQPQPSPQPSTGAVSMKWHENLCKSYLWLLTIATLICVIALNVLSDGLLDAEVILTDHPHVSVLAVKVALSVLLLLCIWAEKDGGLKYEKDADRGMKFILIWMAVLDGLVLTSISGTPSFMSLVEDMIHGVYASNGLNVAYGFYMVLTVVEVVMAFIGGVYYNNSARKAMFINEKEKNK